MIAEKELTPELIRKLVAEGLGWRRRNTVWWQVPKDQREDPHIHLSEAEFDTNLQQAVDHLFSKIQNVSGWGFSRVWEEVDKHEHGSKGETVSQRMAWALCIVFLKVKGLVR